MGQTALGDAAQMARFIGQRFAAHPVIVLQTVIGAAEQIGHHVLFTETVPIIGQVLDPVVDVLTGQYGLKIASGHTQQAAPFVAALVGNQNVQVGVAFFQALRRPHTSGAAADNQNVWF